MTNGYILSRLALLSDEEIGRKLGVPASEARALVALHRTAKRKPVKGDAGVLAEWHRKLSVGGVV